MNSPLSRPQPALLGMAFLLTLAASSWAASPTAFTYQGRLAEQGQPANGIYDFRFDIRDAAVDGTALRDTQTKRGVQVRDGVFTVAIDFGSSVFDGEVRWLDIAARTNGGSAFISLAPLQPIRPTPVAIAANALNGTVTASQVTGSLGSGALAGPYENPVRFNSSSNSFAGDGSGLRFGGFSITNLPFYWNTKGNAGTTPGLQFLGTLDAQPLELRVNSQRVLRLEPTSVSPNLIGGFGGNFADAGTIGSTIGGGGTLEAPNRIIKDPVRTDQMPPEFGVIGGGSGNTISGASYVTIGGGANNYVSQVNWSFPTPPNLYSVIAGGGGNVLVSAFSSTISGGTFNRMTGDPGQLPIGGTIGGGTDNSVSTITYNVNQPTIAGGYGNRIVQADFASIGGGRQNLVNNDSSHATIGGGGDNSIGGMAEDAAISGGFSNEIKAHAGRATIGGGAENLVQRYARNATIAGGLANDIGEEARGAVISGGESNQANGRFSTVSGGAGNLIRLNTLNATIGGGSGNQIQTPEGRPIQSAVIVGGQENLINSADYANIGGGRSNVIQLGSIGAVIGGGEANRMDVWCMNATISGGTSNVLGWYNYGSTIAGGIQNFTGSDARYSTIGGGVGNRAGGRDSRGVVIGGGLQNSIDAFTLADTVGGGQSNHIDYYTQHATIGGGSGNLIRFGDGVSQEAFVAGGTIGGGIGNILGTNATASVISGGESNQANGPYSSIGGGFRNQMVERCIASVIAGGSLNSMGRFNNGVTISGGAGNAVGWEAHGSTIGGGAGNRVTPESLYVTVAGGRGNVAGGPNSQGATVGGGLDNRIGYRLDAGTIGGGSGNLIGAYSSYATISGGRSNLIEFGEFGRGLGTIGGGFANVIGTRSKAAVISGGESNRADGSYSTVPGGRFNTASGTNSFAAGNRAKATNDGAFVWADSDDADFTSTGTNQFLIRASGGVGIGTDSPQFALHVNGDAGKPGGGAWSVASDARLKKDIRPLEQALARLMKLQGVTYEYKNPAAIHELPGQQTGLIAQEVEKVFPEWVETAQDGMRRLSVRGFEALTVEALRELRTEKDDQINARDAQINALEKRLSALERMMTAGASAGR